MKRWHGRHGEELIRHGRSTLLPALLLVACSTWACAPAQTDAEWDVLMAEADTSATSSLSATVVYLDLEGGQYVLQSEDGTNHDPTNLPDAYRQDGTRVEADVIRRDDMASIGMVGPIVDIVRIRLREETPSDGRVGVETAEPGAQQQGDELWGTSWRLVDLGGAGVVDSAVATLQFPEPGLSTGNASCNQYSGPVRVVADSVSFGPLAATRRACSPPLNEQETRFLRALETAVSFGVHDQTLVIESSELAAPLRFVHEEAPDEESTQADSAGRG